MSGFRRSSRNSDLNLPTDDDDPMASGDSYFRVAASANQWDSIVRAAAPATETRSAPPEFSPLGAVGDSFQFGSLSSSSPIPFRPIRGQGWNAGVAADLGNQEVAMAMRQQQGFDPSRPTATMTPMTYPPSLGGPNYFGPLLPNRREELRSSVRPGRECKFCKSNGEPPQSYQSHVLRNPETGQLICPVLRAHHCEVCGATGDDAHTRNYCPKVKMEDKLKMALPNYLKRTRRQSDGQLRR